MNTIRKCRAKGGVQSCTDPRCPEKMDRAAAMEAEKSAFFRSMPTKPNFTDISQQVAYYTQQPLPQFESFQEANTTSAVEGRSAPRVSVSRHPSAPLVTFKYSQDTQFTQNWDDVTLNARGIIFNEETGEIVARPYTKFFNHNEPCAPKELFTGPIEVTDKEDGSLGISYINPNTGELEIASSGSFSSEQALHATALYKERYAGTWEPDPDHTYMWEVVYPENRIVVDYGDRNELILIGARNIKTGETKPLSEITEWNGPRAEVHKFNSLSEVVASSDRPNKEGFIVHFTDTDTRVKLKHEEYLNLHRKVTGVTPSTIWESLKFAGDDDHKEIEEYRRDAPEEFLDFVDTTRTKLEGEYNKKYAAQKEFNRKFHEDAKAAGVTERKDIAQRINAGGYSKDEKNTLFAFLSNPNPIENERFRRNLWDSIKPDGKDSKLSFWNANSA